MALHSENIWLNKKGLSLVQINLLAHLWYRLAYDN